MKIAAFISFLSILLFFAYPVEDISIPAAKSPESEITFSVVGDLMVHSIQRTYAFSDSIYDFNPVFREVKRYLQAADFTIGNLETVISSSDSLSGYPRFNAPSTFLSALKNSGFDLLYLANNHMLDYGEKGIKETLKSLRSESFYHSGISSGQDSISETELIDIKGLKTSFLAYTYRTNLGGKNKRGSYSVNRIDSAKIVNDIIQAKKEDPDLIIVYYHFGIEYKSEESLYQKKYEQIAIDNGADIILASHPHVIQPVRKFRTKNGNPDTGFTAYSLGNFVSNQRWRYSDGGVILNFTIVKNFETGSIKLKDINYLPVWVYKGDTGDNNEFVIIPQGAGKYDYPDYIKGDDYTNMIRHFEDTKLIMTKYSDRVKLRPNTISSKSLAQN